MTRVVSTNIPLEDTFLNQDTRSMVEQSKVGIVSLAVDAALVLEYKTCPRARARNCPSANVFALVV